LNILKNQAYPSRIIVCLIGLCLNFGLGVAQSQTKCVSPLNDTNYSRYIISEYAEYVQTNAAGPILSGSNAFFFRATVTLKTNLSASDASLTVPGQSSQIMTGTNSGHFSVTVVTNSFSNLSAAYPAGDYIFTISNETTTVDLPEGFAIPNAPGLAAYASAQSINSAQDYTLTWNAFDGGVAKDFISVDIVGDSGSVFDSPDYGCPGALNGTSNSILIPANTLASSTAYRAVIVFTKVLTLDTNTTPSVALEAGTQAETTTSIATAAGGSDLGFTNLTALPGGSIQFDLTTTPGQTYEIQFNSVLSNPAGWTPLLVTNASTNMVTFTNSPPSGLGFYRAVRE
jgi:hypothetical protein